MQLTILDHLNTAVIALDEQLRVKYLNSAAELMLDISLKRIEGHRISSLIENNNLQADIDRAMTDHHQLTRRETELSIQSESMIVDYSVTPVLLPERGLIVEIYQRDRLHRITREESLIAKQATSRSMIRGLAHEVKNPLGGIRGAAQLLAKELDNPELNDFTDIIIQEADRLRDLVDRMLGPINPPEMVSTNIHQVLDRVVQLTSAETEGALQLIRDYDPSIPDIPADAERLIQAVLNIVRNAMQAIRQAMPLSEGVITLRSRITRQFTIGTQKPRQVCHISIIDNGPGIPPELIDSIFFPMISGRSDGSGLGLPISQSIISQHEGLIECDSCPGTTTFNIYLPLSHEGSHEGPSTKQRSKA